MRSRAGKRCRWRLNRFLSLIENVDRALCPQESVEGYSGRWHVSPASQKGLGEDRRHAGHRRDVEGAVAILVQNAELGLANARRVLQHGLEDGLQVAGRARYHLQ